MRVLPATSFLATLSLLAAPAVGSETGALARVEAGVKEAALAIAGPKPFVDIVCPLMQQEAEAPGLPPMVFVRLIWKESRFNPQAVSPKGAQGIAQFMPGTAADRGLDDPFEPKSAIVHSASLLADLATEFGNVGLAAAAYNAGAERVKAWLAGSSGLPPRPRAMCTSSPAAAPRNGSCPRPRSPRRSRPRPRRCQDPAASSRHSWCARCTRPSL